MPFTPDQYLLTMEKNMVSQASQIKRLLGKGSRKVIWALPPVLLEPELRRLSKQIRILLRAGFKSYQLGNISQTILFEKERVHLYGDFTLNLMNNQAVQFISQAGFSGLQLSIESDRGSLRDLIQGYRSVLHAGRTAKDKARVAGPSVNLGLTVFGAPPLFTSRLAAKHFQFNKTLVSPKGEPFTVVKKEGVTQVLSTRPFSLLPYLYELKGIGLDYMVVDITGMPSGKRELLEISERLSGKGRFGKLPTFNYLGTLE